MSDVDTEYHQLLGEISDYYDDKWLPVDQALRICAIVLVVLLIADVASSGDGYLGKVAILLTAIAVIVNGTIGYLHARRTRTLLALHGKALTRMYGRL